MLTGTPFHPVVIAPTYNNARMLYDVLTDIAAQGLPVLVINDGSTDNTASILDRWEAETADEPAAGLQAISHRVEGGSVAVATPVAVQPPAAKRSAPLRMVVTHPVNQGKAAALQTGFREALQRGYTHAITIDTDGQLDPDQIADFVDAGRAHPHAIIVGERDETTPDYPQKSRAGRRVSNFWVAVESGAKISDSQCGFRAYPLDLVTQLKCKSGRYGFETEVLSRAAWAGVMIRHVPVTCAYDIPGGRVSHLKPFRDTCRGIGMHARLMLRTLNPWPVPRVDQHDHPQKSGTVMRRLFQWFSPARAWRQMRNEPHGRSRFAAGLATGVFIANLPAYGAQTLLSLYAARKLKLHPLPVVIGSHASTPPLGFVLVALAIAVGHWLLHGEWPAWQSFNPHAVGYATAIKSVVVEWLIGSPIVGLVAAGVTFGVARLMLGPSKRDAA